MASSYNGEKLPSSSIISFIMHSGSYELPIFKLSVGFYKHNSQPYRPRLFLLFALQNLIADFIAEDTAYLIQNMR